MRLTIQKFSVNWNLIPYDEWDELFQQPEMTGAHLESNTDHEFVISADETSGEFLRGLFPTAVVN